MLLKMFIKIKHILQQLYNIFGILIEDRWDKKLKINLSKAKASGCAGEIKCILK